MELFIELDIDVEVDTILKSDWPTSKNPAALIRGRV